MNAEVLKWTGTPSTPDAPVGTGGTWVNDQDPITGEIINRWEPTKNDDNPNTPADESTTTFTIQCIARGIVDGGIRVAGTTERFGDRYENTEYVHMWVPAKTLITKRDRITNIRFKKNGTVVWVDEEFDGTRPTVFNVNGVSPLFDAFNRHIENYVMLEKAEPNG